MLSIIHSSLYTNLAIWKVNICDQARTLTKSEKASPALDAHGRNGTHGDRSRRPALISTAGSSAKGDAGLTHKNHETRREAAIMPLARRNESRGAGAVA